MTSTLDNLEWIEDTVYITASVLGADGARSTRLCAAFGQFPYVGELDPDSTHKVVITGLASRVTIYTTTEAFHRSEDGDRGPLDNVIGMPDGTTMDRLRFAVGSFIPIGMFGGNSPMASFSGEVAEAFAYTVVDTGATIHVARVTAVECLTVYVCWPSTLHPSPKSATSFRSAHTSLRSCPLCGDHVWAVKRVGRLCLEVDAVRRRGRAEIARWVFKPLGGRSTTEWFRRARRVRGAALGFIPGRCHYVLDAGKLVVQGRTPVPAAAWVNNTISLDTGAVLTAWRYPSGRSSLCQKRRRRRARGLRDPRVAAGAGRSRL